MHKKMVFIAILVVLFSVVSMGMTAQESTHFAGGWPYSLPPDGHFNTFSTGRMDLGIYFDLMQPSSATYIWGEGRYEPLLAESFGFDADNNYTVTLKSGVTWSDGTPVTSADVVATFNTGYLLSWAVWNSIDGVEAVDDMTAKFTVSSPSPLVERRILTEAIRPASTYGDIGTRAAELIAADATTGNADFDALLTELTEFRPEMYVASGPYQLLAENISDANLRLTKNEGGLNSDMVLFDEILVWNGETEAVTPLVANQELWYGTYGFPPATEAAFIEAGIDILRGPGYSGPAIYFNHSVYPLNLVEVRQAMAYVIDREENGFVSLGESGIGVECMCGFSDNLVGNWISEEVADGFNYYDVDPDMATSLLEGIGFSKGEDGIWVDDQGNPLAFELIFPAEFADWAAAAENATAQLNEFGFQITARGVQFQQQQQEVYDSNFQMAIRNWGTTSPFPGEHFLEAYNRYNGQGQLAGEGVGGGMQFDNNVTYSGGEFNALDAANAANQGTDRDAQAALVEQLAVSYNELLPAVPLWERYGNNPMNRSFLEAPTADDVIYKNPWSGVDAFVPYLILNGRIAPAGN